MTSQHCLSVLGLPLFVLNKEVWAASLRLVTVERLTQLDGACYHGGQPGECPGIYVVRGHFLDMSV